MKKVIALILLFVITFSGCGGSSGKKVDSGIQNVDDLEAKVDAAMKEAGITSEYDIVSHEWGLANLGVETKCRTEGEEFEVYSMDTSYGKCAWKVLSVQSLDSKKYYYSTSEHDDVYDYATGKLMQEGEPLEIPVKSGIESSVYSHINDNFKDTDIDSITVNNDSIVLVYLTWNTKNTAETSKKMLKMYSDDLAATLSDKYHEVTEVAVFWKVPYLTTETSKWHYSCKDGKAFLDDNIVNF